MNQIRFITGFRRLLISRDNNRLIKQKYPWILTTWHTPKYGYSSNMDSVNKSDTVTDHFGGVSGSAQWPDRPWSNDVDIKSTLGLGYEDEATHAELDFENAEKAFANQSNLELLRAMLILRICSYNVFVNNALKLWKIGQGILGKRLFSSVMKATFYSQFVSGETSEEIGKTVARLSSAQIGSMLHITAEDSSGCSDKEQWYNTNADGVLECINLQTTHCDTSQQVISQIKLSSFIDTELLDKLEVVLKKNGRNFDNDSLVNYKNFAQGLDGNLQPIPELTAAENEALAAALQRINKVAQKSVDCDFVFLVDAEYYSNCSTMAMITFAMMSKFNHKKTYVWGTYQALLKETFNNLCKDGELAKKENFGFGFKLVRGAYLETEKALALKNGFQAPTNDSYEKTNLSYNKCMDYAFNQIRNSLNGKYITMFATHNEKSVKRVVAKMKKEGIEKKSGKVYFGQLMGMCDHVSYSLGKAGYLIHKSVPCGSIEDVMPNMSRRAIENKSVFARLDKEKKMLSQALRKRIF
ncbi:hydroxyproline dehydrogenase-like [Antedon mediterranea]|uniref:hydroxyproline dehydrogenase-like n=1 Tax=Antedon mediterranea TaxID=105859 RepID=UPI003AF8B69D